MKQNSKLIENIAKDIRTLGYHLATREIYGENSKEYYQKKREHDRLLDYLYKLENKTF